MCVCVCVVLFVRPEDLAGKVVGGWGVGSSGYVTVNVGRRRSFALSASCSLSRRLPYISHSSTPPWNLLPANPHRFNNSLSRTAVKTDTRCRVHARRVLSRDFRYRWRRVVWNPICPPPPGLGIRVRTTRAMLYGAMPVCAAGSGVFELSGLPVVSRENGEKRRDAHNKAVVLFAKTLPDINIRHARVFFVIISLLLRCTENTRQL